MARPELRVKRRSYTRSDGTRVKAVTFLTPDKGEPGRTPKSRRWYSPSVHTGWKAILPMAERRRLVLLAHKSNLLASARAMQALSNVLQKTNPDASRKAKSDADYFFKLNRAQ